MISDIVPPRHLIELYIISNTPLFFYTRLLKDWWVCSLVNMYPVEQLVEKFNSIANAEAKSLESVVSAYSILASLTTGANFNQLANNGYLSTKPLRWGAHFLGYSDHFHKNNTLSRLQIPQVSPSIKECNQQNVSFSRGSFAQEHKVAIKGGTTFSSENSTIALLTIPDSKEDFNG